MVSPTLIKLAIKLAIFSAIIIVAIVVLNKFKILDFASVFERKPLEIEESAVIVEDVIGISKLFSMVSYDEIILDTTKVIKGLIYNTDSKIILIARGTCYAGTDLATFDKKNIEVKDSICTITIPTAKIFNTVINPSDFEFFQDDGGWSFEETRNLKTFAVKLVEKQAIKYGILEKANERSKKLFEDFLKDKGYKEVIVNILK